MSQSMQCIGCIHYQMEMKCDAFPEQIPDAIFIGEIDHEQPHPGDHGIQWEPAVPTMPAVST
jgi:hypothetical protein